MLVRGSAHTLVLRPSAVIATLIIGLSCTDVFAEEKSTFGYGAETDFSSAYVWRGIVLDDRPVSENSAWIEGFGLSLTAWGNLTLRATENRPRVRVSGMTLAYSRDWKNLTIEPAVEAYRWPADLGSGNTIEGSLRLSYKSGPFRAFTEHAFDTFADKGAYFGEAGLGYERHIAQHTEVAIQGSSGWASSKFNDANIGVRKPAVNFLRVETSLTHYLKPYLYIRPPFTFFNIPDRRLSEELPSRNFTTFGFATGFEF